MTRNLCSLMCLVAVLFMGVATQEKQVANDKATYASGDCECVESACPTLAVPATVDCAYGQVIKDPLEDPEWVCQCPASQWLIYKSSTPRERVCDDGPNSGDMSCDCKCHGVDESPDCVDCVDTCDTRPALPPDDDPCDDGSGNQFYCEGGFYAGQQWPTLTCTLQ